MASIMVRLNLSVTTSSCTSEKHFTAIHFLGCTLCRRNCTMPALSDGKNSAAGTNTATLQFKRQKFPCD